MKKLFILSAIILLAFTGCSKDDDDSKNANSFNKTSLSLYVDGTHQLFQSSNANAISSNRFVASISSSGTVTADHVGITTITLGSNRCDVTVKPRYTIYSDPYINWGASKATVKSVCGTPYSESATGLIYQMSSSINMLYSFENEKLKGVAVTVNSALASQLSSFLGERYEIISLDPDEEVIAMYANGYAMEEITTVVGVQIPNINYFMVLYIPNNQARSKSTDLTADFNELSDRMRECKPVGIQDPR